MLGGRDHAGRLVAAAGLLVLLAGCASDGPGESNPADGGVNQTTRNGLAAAPGLTRALVPVSPRAAETLAQVQRRFEYRTVIHAEPELTPPTSALAAAIPPGVVEQFERDDNDGIVPLVPEVETARLVRPARVTLSANASGPTSVEDTRSGAVVQYALEDAADAEIEIADGLALFPGGASGKHDVVRRVDGEGVEDYVVYEQAPSRETVRYRVDVTHVDGMRLVGNVLEFMRDGQPMLRMSAPYVVGADRKRHIGGISVEGCAYDTTPFAQGKFEPVAPGAPVCTVLVSWAPSDRPGCVRHDGSDDCAPVAYPALLDPYWSTTGNMAWARYHFPTVSRWSIDGASIYAIGGNDGTNDLPYVEYQSAMSTVWTSTSQMGTARRAHQAGWFKTAIEGIVVGGGFNGTAAQSTGERLTGTTWSATGAMPGVRAQAAAVELPSGKVMLIGGSLDGSAAGQLDTTAIYNPDTNSWAAGPTMSSKRAGHTATLLTDNSVLVTGGWNGSATVSSVDRYVEGGTWTPRAAMGQARFRHGAALVGSSVLIAGGTNALSDATRTVLASAQLYNPSTNAWTNAGNMNVARELFALLPLSGFRVVAAGGRDTTTHYTNTADVFNGTSTWAAITNMASNHMLCGASVDNGAFVAGGKISDTVATKTTEFFDLLPNGSACVAGSAFLCDSGNCVDGYCCNTTCANACDSCSLTGSLGTCKAMTAGSTGSPACTNGYACNGTLATCPTSCTIDAHCASAYYCSATGVCTARKNNGTSCNLAAGSDCKVANCRACTSGYCVDGTCCSSTCTTQCKSCANASGACTTNVAKYSEDTNSSPTCSGTSSCDGAGACKKDNGQTCSAASDCSSGYCVDGYCCTDGCTTSCKSCANTSGTCTTNVAKYTEDANSSPTCSGTNSCDGAGTCKKDNGQTCSASTECSSGNCIDGRCCTDGCTTACKSCANTSGTCTTNVAKYTEDANSSPTCSGANSCDGVGTCKKDNGQTCSAASECASGYCVDGHCCTDGCTTSCKSCSNASGTCTTNVTKYTEDANSSPACSGVNSCDGAGTCKKDNGQSCSAASACASGYCVDGVCCESGCTTACKSCANAAGTCTTNIAKYSEDANSSPACSGSSSCDGAGTCKKDNGQTCSTAAECASGFCIDGTCCTDGCTTSCKSCANASGTCTTNVPQLADDANSTPACSGTSTCDGAGTCKKDNGQICTAASECSSGYCVDGRCCESGCTTACKSCGNTAGTCTTNIAQNTDDLNSSPQCTGTQTCDNAGSCKKDRGETCSAASECASGYCVDGVCCNGACGNPCDSCNVTGLEGTCSTTPTGSATCNGYACDGQNTSCPTLCASDLGCATTHYCAANATCQPRKSAAAACNTAAGADCKDNGCRACNDNLTCADGYCCTSPCSGQCDECSSTPGTCKVLAAGSAGNPSCAPSSCNGTLPTCAGGCTTDAQCANGYYCNASGQCVQKKSPGSTCNPTAGADCYQASCAVCTTGQCVDGRCCSSPCTEACGTCTGTTGVCHPETVGTTSAACAPYLCNGLTVDCPTACAYNGQCDANSYCSTSGVCVTKRTSGQGCTSADECLSGFCVDGTCCQNACTDTCKSCANATGACATNVPQFQPDLNAATPCSGTDSCDGQGNCRLNKGQTCTAAGDCSSGYCVDATCCENACTAPCKSCASPSGSCVINVDQGSADPNAVPACQGSSFCDGAGTCKKVQGQACAGNGECLTGYCSDGFCCNTACSGSCDACDQAGFEGTCRIRAEGSQQCADFVCDGISSQCPSACPGDRLCHPSYYCAKGGACLPRKSTGAACNDIAGGDCVETACRVCSSDHCTDNVCCGTACGGQCDECSSTPGTCKPMTAGSAGNPACGGSACDGTATSCPGGCTSDTQCVDGYYCNAAGACVTKKSKGEACNTSAGQDCLQGGCAVCATGYCADGYCCDSACDGSCDSCSASPGTCVFSVIGAAGTPSCAPFVCTGQSAQCPQTCANSQFCEPDRYCSAGQCLPKGALGDTCTVNDACVSGICADGMCCDTYCSGSCDRCNVPGSAGTCTNVAGPGIPGCNGYLCNGATSSCPVSCNSNTDCDAGYRCNNGQCEAKQPNGIPCAQNSDCTSGFCVDTVCCESSCNGTCQSCVTAYTGLASDGLCGSVVAGEDPRGACAESNVETCDFSGTCDGAGSCALYALGTQCKPAACEGNSAASYACDGAGACVTATSESCGLAKCTDGACPTTCVQDADCSGDAYCNTSTSTCVAKTADGATCQAGRTCTSGYCVDDVCCDRLCDGQCESCGEGSSKGTCVPVTGAPRFGRTACEGAPGTDVCKARACDGEDRTSCAGYEPNTTVCKPAACADGYATLDATCDAKGACVEKAPVKCEPYVCQGDHCGSKPCSTNADCADKFRCDPSLKDCVPLEASVCDADGKTLRSPDGSQIDCSPYSCEGSACRTDCKTTAHCVSGFVCDSSTSPPQCVSPSAFEANKDEGGCGCRAASRSQGLPWAWALAGLAAMTAALRRTSGRRSRRG